MLSLRGFVRKFVMIAELSTSEVTLLVLEELLELTRMNNFGGKARSTFLMLSKKYDDMFESLISNNKTETELWLQNKHTHSPKSMSNKLWFGLLTRTQYISKSCCTNISKIDNKLQAKLKIIDSERDIWKQCFEEWIGQLKIRKSSSDY